VKRARFDRRGMLAIAPSAIGMLFDLPEAPRVEMRGDIAVVSVCGPLVHHVDTWFDSYDAIKGRVAEALSASPRAVVLAIDSPGGLVSGCFDTAAEIRDLCAKAGVPLHAYVDGLAASAAYALASVAADITIPATGIVGSIGTIEMLVDWSAQNAAMGLGVELIASGARKTDGNPNAPITDGARAAAQARVNELAEVFFAHVATGRPRLSVDAVRALEAGLMTGQSAVRAGLADRVGSLDDLVAMLAAGSAAPRAQEGHTMTEEEKARAALKAIVDDEKSDDKAKARAKAALAAMDGDDEDKDKGDEAKAEDKRHEEPDGDEAKASAKAAAAVAPLAATSASLEARLAALEAERETERLAAIFAARPDVGAETRRALAHLPSAQVKAILDSMPKREPKPAATAVVPATQGGAVPTQAQSQHVSDVDVNSLRVRMGLDRVALTGARVSEDGSRIELGVPEIVKKGA
jgi:ClpP class serine protease